jgi:hypothetical protein
MKTFMVHASLTIVTYDCKNMFIVQATELTHKYKTWLKCASVLTLMLISLMMKKVLYSWSVKSLSENSRVTILSSQMGSSSKLAE